MIEKHLYDMMCGDLFPVFKKLLDCEKYAITLGGSHGKGISDIDSDFDFRIYYEKSIEPEQKKTVFNEISNLVSSWKERGVEVDGIWPRSIGDIDKQLDAWLSGNGELVPYRWNIWGYNILTDIYNQQIVEDPYQIARQWKKRLSIYPEALKKSIINKHASSLRYWRADYHYLNKVKRKDTVFLASITSRLINDIIQVIYALNKFYYPGDGHNLKYTTQFEIKPIDFEERVVQILYPTKTGEILVNQYNSVIKLIDDTLILI